MEREVRATTKGSNLAVRSAGKGKGTVLTGYAIRYGELSDNIGDFYECCQFGACADSLKNNDILCYANHDSTMVLGRTSSYTLGLTEDKNGVAFSLLLPDSYIGNAIATSVDRGDLFSMSFGFYCVSDFWGNPSDFPTVKGVASLPPDAVIRCVEDMELFEVSIVGRPAYPSSSCGF